jgi:hypothetical protein
MRIDAGKFVVASGEAARQSRVPRAALDCRATLAMTKWSGKTTPVSSMSKTQRNRAAYLWTPPQLVLAHRFALT